MQAQRFADEAAGLAPGAAFTLAVEHEGVYQELGSEDHDKFVFFDGSAVIVERTDPVKVEVLPAVVAD